MINPASSALVEGNVLGASSCDIEEAVNDTDTLESIMEDTDPEEGDDLILTVCGHVHALAKELKAARAELAEAQTTNARILSVGRGFKARVEHYAPIIDALLLLDPQTLPREFAELVMKWRANTG